MSIHNKRGGGIRKEGNMQGINVCLIEKDTICREKIVRVFKTITKIRE